MDALGVQRFHLVGAKIGGIIARAFAARRPERVATLTVVGSPPPLRQGAELLVIPGNSFYVAGSDAERCARATRDFIGRRGGGA